MRENAIVDEHHHHHHLFEEKEIISLVQSKSDKTKNLFCDLSAHDQARSRFSGRQILRFALSLSLSPILNSDLNTHTELTYAMNPNIISLLNGDHRSSMFTRYAQRVYGSLRAQKLFFILLIFFFKF